MKIYLFLVSLVAANVLYAQRDETSLPVRGFAIAAPKPKDLTTFNNFIANELAPRKVNTLVLRIEYNYQFKSHPELRDSIALSEKDVKSIVDVCKANGINIIPQINLLGHQSWASRPNNLLKNYPQFNVTPHVKMPDKYISGQIRMGFTARVIVRCILMSIKLFLSWSMRSAMYLKRQLTTPAWTRFFTSATINAQDVVAATRPNYLPTK